MKRPTRTILALAFLAGCSKAPSQAECEQLLAHVIELETAAAGGGTTPEAKAALDVQRAKIAEWVGKDFRATCLAELPRSQVRCGLSASSLEALSACDDK